MRTVRLTASAFQKRRDGIGLTAGTTYIVSDDYAPDAKSYGFSPDGDGVLWFDTLAELRAECG